MKNKGLYITTAILFILVNTSYYWEGLLLWTAFPVFIVLFLLFVLLAGICVYHFFLYVLFARHRYFSKLRLVIFMASLLGLVAFKPNGFIDYDNLEGKDLLVASREGAANCMITLKLKDSNKFNQRDVCFGVQRVTGSYAVYGDTILFQRVWGVSMEPYYDYAIIKEDTANNFEYLHLYHSNGNDSLVLFVKLNELK